MSDRRPAHQGGAGEDEAATNISSDTTRVLTWEASAVLGLPLFLANCIDAQPPLW